MPITHVALVGHCGFDSGSFKRFAGLVAPQAQVSRVNDQGSLDGVAGPGTLLLVNRELDGRFSTGRSGIDLIRSYTEGGEAPAMMLVSNYADAQEAAPGEALLATLPSCLSVRVAVPLGFVWNSGFNFSHW